MYIVGELELFKRDGGLPPCTPHFRMFISQQGAANNIIRPPVRGLESITTAPDYNLPFGVPAVYRVNFAFEEVISAVLTDLALPRWPVSSYTS